VQAEQVPIVEYYAALTAARATPNDAAIDKYVDTGITLVNSYCLRWFQHLSEQDIKKSFADSNINVIRALGTALLGLGKANSLFVTGYGASNTAYEGLSKSYGDAFLLAPNSRKVKAQILSLLDARIVELTEKNRPKTFAEAYRKLERFADLCTHATAKEVVNNALDQADATANSAGKITLTANASGLAAASLQAALTAIKATAEKDVAVASNKSTQDALKFLQDKTKLELEKQKLQIDFEALGKKQVATATELTKTLCALAQAKKSPPESDESCNR